MRLAVFRHTGSTHMHLAARRSACQAAAACWLACLLPDPALRVPPAGAAAVPLSSALDKAEYSNSVVASRDTNVSPREVYDTIRDKCRPPDGATRALDVPRKTSFPRQGARRRDGEAPPQIEIASRVWR